MTSDCMDDRTTTRISLKPCPFCGSPAELEEDSDHHGKWFNLGCSNHWGKRSDEKHCIGARIFYTAAPKEKSGAIEKWNTRAQGAATPAPTAALTEEEREQRIAIVLTAFEEMHDAAAEASAAYNVEKFAETVVSRLTGEPSA